MDILKINQLIEEQLKNNGIMSGTISILEKEWGYVVQIKNDEKYFNGILDKEGNVIFPFGIFESDSGDVYLTEVFNHVDKIIPVKSSVSYKELDDSHFIIPRSNKEKPGSALFWVDEDNNVTYKGYIEGKITGNALHENKELIKQKQVLSTVKIGERKQKISRFKFTETTVQNECFFYSWDKNCRTSDKWSRLCNNMYGSILNDYINLPNELSSEIVKYLEENRAWLATLELNSKDNEQDMNLICLVGDNGIPLTDLIYVSQTYSVETIPLKKEKIGEVDQIKVLLQERLDKKAAQIAENKKNIAANFLRATGLTTKDTKAIIDTNNINDRTNR